MSNNSSARSSVLATTESTATGATFSVDGYADRLMDELFEEVEGLVGGEAKTVTPPQPIAPAPVESAESLATVSESVDVSTYAEADEGADDLAVPELDEMLTEPEPEAPRRGWVQSLMVATTGVAIVVLTVTGVALYYKTQGITPVSSPDAAMPENQANLEFAEYMQRSLDAIHRRADHQAIASGEPTGEMPTVAVSGTPGAGEQAGTVLERVYIPVYQPSPTTTATLPTQPNTPSTPPRLSTDSTTAAAPAASPHLLVGVLELGDRSAALFEINGQTQRVYVGETIGTSGWTLVSVANQEAIVRRNGDVRSIYVGQQF